jgi:hypothetical protein
MHFGGHKYWTFELIINREPSDKPDDWQPASPEGDRPVEHP